MSIGPGFAAFWDSGAQAQSFPNSNGDTARKINDTYATNPWDIVYMAGMPLPGFCKVLNGLTEIGIDMKKPDGKDGATITVKGYKPGKFDVSCTMWTEAQWDAYRKIRQTVFRHPQKKSKLSESAINIAHPALEDAGIFSCVVQGVTFPQPGEFEGSKVVTFKCVENVPAGTKKQTKTAKASSPPLIPKYDPGKEPVNSTPPRPSSVEKNLGPKGPPTPPATGGI